MARYNIQTRPYNRPNKIMETLLESEAPLKYKEEGLKMIWIMYTGTDVVISEEVKLISFPSFIGGVGGNLGLFLGFSCLGTLFLFYKQVLVLLSKCRT